MRKFEDRREARGDERLGIADAPPDDAPRSHRLVVWYVSSLLVGLILLGSFYNVIHQAVLRIQQHGPLIAQSGFTGKAGACDSAESQGACTGLDVSARTNGNAARLMVNGR